jgi:SulP family sulfate permease
MLAFLTLGVLFIGPVIIGFIPVMMVGTLIFLLGFELFLEAVWDARRKLKALEYLTVSHRQPIQKIDCFGADVLYLSR